MGRRKKQSGFEALAALPWPLGLVAGIVGYLGVRYGVGWWFSHHGGMLSQGFAQQSSGAFAPLAWMLLGICWLAALCSYLGSRSRQRFLDTRTTLESLAAGGWRQFERLVGEAFRRQGYSVDLYLYFKRFPYRIHLSRNLNNESIYITGSCTKYNLKAKK